MRSYRIEELLPDNVQRVKEALRAGGFEGAIDDIYYLPVPDELLTEEQRAHLDGCGPYIMAIESGKDWLKLELLVRARGRLRCSCICYASPTLRNHAIDFLDGFIRELDIPV
jgi:hypothetical protein